MTPEERRAKRAARQRAYYERNRDEVLSRRRSNYESERARDRERYHKRMQDPVNRDRHNARLREWRSNNPERHSQHQLATKSKHPEQKYAQNKVRYRVSVGNWPPASFFKCTDCDAQAAEYHHPDYASPLWVEPLCKRCHVNIHTSQTHEKTKRIYPVGRREPS